MKRPNKHVVLIVKYKHFRERQDKKLCGPEPSIKEEREILEASFHFREHK